MDLIYTAHTHTHTHTHRVDSMLCGATAPLMDVHTITDEDMNGRNYREERSDNEHQHENREK